MTYGSINDITNQKKFQLGLMKKQEEMKALIGCIDDIVFVVDANDVFEEVYIKDDNLLFAKREDFIGKNISEILPENIQEKYFQAKEYVTQHKSPFDFNYNMEVNGELKYYMAKLTEVDYTGKFMIAVKDLTKENNARIVNEKLQESLNEASVYGRIGSFDFNVKTYELIWSDQMYEMLGMKHDISMNELFDVYMDAIHPDDFERLSSAISDTTKFGRGYEIEHRIRHANGYYIWLKCIAKVRKSLSGEVEAIRGVAIDISDAKDAETEILRKQNLLEAISLLSVKLAGEEDPDESISLMLRQIGESMRVNAVCLNQAFSMNAVNLPLKRIFEWSDGNHSYSLHDKDANMDFNLIGWSRWMDVLGNGMPVFGCIDEFPAEEQVAMREQNIQSVLTVPINISGNYWGFLMFKVSDKAREWKEDEIILLTAVANLIGTVIERKSYHKKILESEIKYRTAVETMTEGLVIADETGRHQTCNESAGRILGVPAESLIGIGPDKPDYLQLFHEDGSPLTMDDYPCMVALRTNAVVKDFMMGVKVGDADMIWVLMNACPLRSSTGTVTGALITFSDITKRLEFEHQIKASLQQKEILLTEIHHRVKNNMAIVSSLLQLQQFYSNDDKLKSVLKESQGRIRSMSLVHEILYRSGDFSNVDFGKYLNEICRLNEDVYKREGRKVECIVKFESSPVDISRAIPTGLIVNELLTNTMKYAFVGRDSGIINVDFKKQGDYYVLEVADNGVGLPENFDWENSKTMGLTLVRSLATQLKGAATLDRSSGTRVILTFPA